LAVEHRGFGGLVVRVAARPLRGTALGRRWLAEPMGELHTEAADWYERHARPVSVLVAVSGGPGDAAVAARSARRTTQGLKARVEVLAGAANPVTAVNEAIQASPDEDVVLLGPEVVVHAGWLEMLQHAAYREEAEAARRAEAERRASTQEGRSASVEESGRRAAVGGRQLDAEGRVLSCGLFRSPREPRLLGDRYHGQQATDPPAEVDLPVLAETAACLYLRRDALKQVGSLDQSLEPDWAAADWSLRAWQAGLRIVDHPPVSVTQLARSREAMAPDRFWQKWSSWLSGREVRTPDGRLRIAYVTEDTGVGGGHRVVFEHLNRLAARGHDCSLWALDAEPDWFDLQVPVHSFERYEELLDALEPVDAIKVATWWNTSLPVWLASVRHGIPAAFVQDIETSYYPTAPWFHGTVLASYRHEFRTFTTSGWNADRLGEMDLEPEVVSPGIDLDTFRELPGVPRRTDLILAIGRTQPLKNLPLTLDAWRALDEPRPELHLFGSEPAVGAEHEIPYTDRPTDAEVNQLLNEAAVFVQTSAHEGFALPPLEAMAAGCPVVCTDAHGNRDYCEDGTNCLMPDANPTAVATAIRHILEDTDLRKRLVANGRETATRYGWDPRIDTLEQFYEAAAPTLTASPQP
jgi:glycosyltransferase involved in cell wall biosynthesis